MSTPSLPPAWYDDPGGSGGLRWWTGDAWTDHVKPHEAPVQYTQPALPTPPSFPQRGQWDQERIRPVRVDNRVASASLNSGIVSVAAFLVAIVFPIALIASVLAAPTAIVLGIIALSRRPSGRTTALGAPIAGIVLASLTTILLVVGTVAALALLGRP